MPLCFVNLSVVELVIVLAIGLAVLSVPVIGLLLAVRVFNEFETQRRSEVVDQAITRDEEITPLPAADEPAGTDRRV
jgi:hypothetical protein